jgi:glycosyltransferase involved in cell wall biosynthesis
MSPIRVFMAPRLGILNQYPPQPWSFPPPRWPGPAPQSPPKISIVTPSFNQGKFLERTLKSVLDQGYPNLEYVVQDGGSTDDSIAILRRYSDRLSHWESACDAGQAQAINRGFARQTGEIMAWLNSDDLLLPGALEYVARFFTAQPDVGVIYGHRLLIDAHDADIGRWLMPPHSKEAVVWVDFIPQESLFWRRSAWEAVGGHLDESLQFALDWDLLFRFHNSGARFVRVPQFLAAFRVHPEQKTSRQLWDLGAREIALLLRRYHGRDVSQAEAVSHMRGYLLRHVLHHHLFRLRSALQPQRSGRSADARRAESDAPADAPR